MEVVVATRNRSKVEQIKQVFNGDGITFLSLDDVRISGSAIEDGVTLLENATKKALFAWAKSRKWTIAEDTGLFIDALCGAPGIHSARWAGDNKTTEEIMDFTLQKLNGVSPELRTARFKTSVILIRPDGAKKEFHGAVHGSILSEPRGVLQPDMPYSTIYVPKGMGKTWAEMNTDEENRVSHRGQAFRSARAYILSIL